MSLRVKIFLITAVPLIVFLFILHVVISDIIRTRFAEVEESYARLNAERVMGLVEAESSGMARIAADWGRWDSTYRFMGGENSEFRNDLIDESFIDLRINLIALFDLQGRVVFSKGYDLAGRKETAPPEELAGDLPPDSVVMRGAAKPASGILMTSSGPMFVGISPILTSEGKGPSRGILLMGRTLSPDVMSTMLQIIRIPFEIDDLEAASAANSQAGEKLLSGEKILIESQGEDFMAVYARIDDMAGRPVLMARVDMPRDITGYGEVSVRYVTMALGGTGAVIILLIQLILGRFVIRRLADAGRAAAEIGQASDFSRRIPISGRDELSMLVLSVNDMLARLEKANEEVMRAQRVREDFTSTVSHDLRAPLATIKEGVGVVYDGIDGPVNDAQRATLDVVRKNIERMSRLIINVLELSRIESGNLFVSFEETEMKSLVEEVYDSMRSAAVKKGLSFNKSIPEENFSIYCDPERIKQLLVNLVDNAIKFTDHGSVEIRLFAQAGGARMEVADTGVGIALDEQGSVFERFRQARTGKSRRSKGTGLGLSISRHIVERHGGRIHVESSEGEGSTFVVELPGDPPEPQSKS